ncbi:MAG TPA: hypothetical protein VGQ81_16420 [Acidobacteriota bacterium]|jgi:hypothetical protein|nr:hypothetical protein [Acidobacteriota bacterium]
MSRLKDLLPKWILLALYAGLLMLLLIVYLHWVDLPDISDPATFFKIK